MSNLGSRRRMAGLSLIELMIALIMALIVAAGIVSVFASTTSSNKVQAQMATLQEEGRFAIHSLRTDLADANGSYCSNTGGNAGGTSSGLYLDSLRAPTIYAEDPTTLSTVIADITRTYPTPTQAFSLPSTAYMRGYDCDKTTCKPLNPSDKVAGIPAMGKVAGNRVVGADVLTARYLKPGSGWAIVASGSSGSAISASTTSGNTIVTLEQLAGEPDPGTFTGSLAMLADCSNAQVFAVTKSGNTLTASGAGAGGNYSQPMDISQGAAPRVFDFSKDFQTVTYFLRVVCANGAATCASGPTTGELVRRINGTDQPLVRGVERLDFRYGIIDANGATQFLTADEVDSGAVGGATIPCPPGVPLPDTKDGMPGNTPGTGCLWRAVKTIEVHILMDGQTPLYTLTTNEMQYIYSPDNNIVPVAPSAHAIQPDVDQGFPKQLLRREFTALVPLRNFNP